MEMIPELILRFVVGGVVVSLFAMLGGAVKPKSFAGLFIFAPSVALATITLTVVKKGKGYASIEAQSMILGGVAFCIYAWMMCRLLIFFSNFLYCSAQLAMFLSHHSL